MTSKKTGPSCPHCGNTLLISCAVGPEEGSLRRWICAGRFGCHAIWLTAAEDGGEYSPGLTVVLP